MNRVAIVILNYMSWKDTLEEAKVCHEILNIPYKDIIIIDNNSPNESYAELELSQKIKGFILIRSSRNDGYAAGNNIGLRYAYENGYNYAFIMNNDVLIDDRKMVDKLIDTFEKDSSLGVVNPDIYGVDGKLYNRDAKKPSFLDLTVLANSYRKKGRKVKDLGGYAYVYRPQGCCMMVDLEKMQEINYMDENTFLYCEEIILAERLDKKNYKCACCLTTKAIHNHSKTVRSVMDKNKITKMNNNSFRYYLKEYRGFNSVNSNICLFFNWIKWTLLG